MARVNPTGTGLGYATYIGGRGDERTVGIDVDDRGAAHVAGETGSRQPNFPARVGPDLSYNGGGRDAFLARLAPSGTRLDYAGYIGGSGTDIGIGIAVDAAGSAYVAGSTTSTQRSFPVRRGPDLTFNGPAGLTDAFVAKIGTATCLGRPATVVGTPGPDVLTGTDRGDVIAGLGGSDRISGGRGADVLCGGPGRDTCDGGPGRDRTSACEVRRAVP